MNKFLTILFLFGAGCSGGTLALLCIGMAVLNLIGEVTR